MKTGRNASILVALAVLLWLCIGDSSAKSLVGYASSQRLDTSPLVWFEGTSRRVAWLALDEASLELEPAPDAHARVRKSIESLYPGARVTAEDRHALRLDLPRSQSSEEHFLKLRTIQGAGAIRAARPVYYATPHGSPGSRMVLTERIIVQFKPGTSQREVERIQGGFGLKRIRTFPFSRKTFVYDAGSPMLGVLISSRLREHTQVSYAYPDWIRTRVRRAVPDDTLFPDQWHLRNIGQGGGTAGEDADIVNVWDTYRGSANEVIAIVDDGLEMSHPDLSDNVRADLCWDYVDDENDTTDGEHGTSCAGVAAGRGFNALGVTGAAPNARLVGHRILPDSGGIPDSDVVDALTRNNDVIDIYSNSWGPYDGGYLLDGPSPVVLAAIASGISEGRGGLGNIYLWAGGNGGDTDNANYDGYANSRYVIAVAASTNYGIRAYYSEQGANILVNSPSSGGSRGITTTDRTGSDGYDSTGDYTATFGGTSSATPLVAGAVALLLQAHPDLTWRDVRAILAETADKNDPSDADWTANSAGHHVNHKYGFGRINAQAAVSAALSWPHLPTESSVQGTSSPGLSIPDNNATGVSDTITLDSDMSVEYVEVTFSAADHPYWPDLEVVLTSPDGTPSVLARQHAPSSTPYGSYDNWRFGTVRHLGEGAGGTWTLRVRDLASGDSGTLQSWTLTLYGSSDTQAPVISGLSVSPITDSSATVTWTTNEPSDTEVRFGPATSTWDGYPAESHSDDMTTNHSITISGLLDNTTYYLRAGSTDAEGNGPAQNPDGTNPSDELSFTTLEDAPVISDITVSRSYDSATIMWNTDEPADTIVQYGPAGSVWGSYPSVQTDAAYVSHHSITIGSLTEETPYFFRVGSRDASGNGPGVHENPTNPSTEYTFATTASIPYVVGTPSVNFSARTVTITYSETGMQGALNESGYRFSPTLAFRTSGGSDDITQSAPSTYQLSLASLPRYVIYRMTITGITDADGHGLARTSFTLNDNDSDRMADDWERLYGVSKPSADADKDGLSNVNEYVNGTSPVEADSDGDGLPDGWEVRYGIDPLDDSGPNGASGDLDDDGWTNETEYLNGTDPSSASSPLPVPPQVMTVHPHDGAGEQDNTRIPANASFAVQLLDEDGIDLTDAGSILFTIDDGVNEPYGVTLADTDVVRVVKISDDDDSSVQSLWAVYDRSKEAGLGDFPFSQTIVISVQATDRFGNRMEERSYSFLVESRQVSEEALASSPETTPLGEGSTMLGDGYDEGFEVTAGELSGAMVIYSSAEEVKPGLGPSGEILLPDMDGIYPVGEALNLQPPTVFSTPVRVIIPCRGYADLTRISIYLFDGQDWVLACDGLGTVQPDAVGWMVEGSRVDHPDLSPPAIEIGLHHSSAVQAGAPEEPDNGQQSSGGGGGGGCFIATAGHG